jgi:hypothetical protein
MDSENLMKQLGVIPIPMTAGLSGHFEKTLLKELFEAETGIDNRDQQVSTTLTYFNQSTRKDEPMSTKGSIIMMALEGEVMKDLKRLQERIDSEQDVGKTDESIGEKRALDPRLFHVSDDLPQIIKELLLYAHWKLRIPGDCGCQMQVSYSRRGSKSLYKSPTDKTVCRIVLHFGPDDVYKLTEVLTNGQYGESKNSVMSTGSSIMLGAKEFENCNVFVPSGVKFEFPSILPPNIESIARREMKKMKGGGKGSMKSMDMNRLNSMSKRSGMRMKSYRRISVVMDFGPSHYVNDSKILEYANNLNNGGIPNEMPTDLPDHIKARLPPKISGLISNSKGKLNRKVKEVGQKVYSDIKDRQELKSSTPNITNDLINDIGKSVQSNINRKDVEHLKPEIDEIAKELGMDDKSMSAMSSAFKREERRKRQRQRRKERRRMDRKMNCGTDCKERESESEKKTEKSEKSSDIIIVDDYKVPDIMSLDL